MCQSFLTSAVWYKATHCIFPPAAVLCTLMAQAQAPGSPLSFVLTPWLAGHVCLYTSALGLSYLRRSARLAISQQRLRDLRTLSDESLKSIFNQFDTSKDGSLDAEELKLAMKVALGIELGLDDCKRLVGDVDTDGNGVIDFGEFRQICKSKAE